jgi:MFS family permease
VRQAAPIATPPSRSRLVTGSFVVVTTATFAYFTCLGMLIPVIPRFVRDDLGGGGLGVGVAVGAFAVSAALCRPFLGRLGDRYGRRVLVVAGSSVVAVTVGAYAVATTIAALVVLRFLSGIGEAGMFIGAATAIQDMAPDERRGEAASYFSIALYGGLALGPPLGETLYQAHGAVVTWFVAAGAALMAAVLGLRTPVGARSDDPIAGRPILHREALLPGGVLFLGLVGFAGYSAFVPLYVDEIGLADAGPVFAVYAGVILAIRLVGARLPDRLGPVRTATLSLVALAAGLTVIAAWASPTGLYVGTVVFSVGMALLFPAMFAAVMGAVSERERSHAVGTFSLFFDLSQGFGAVLLGAVVVVADERGAFAAGAVVALGGLVLLRGVMSRRTIAVARA